MCTWRFTCRLGGREDEARCRCGIVLDVAPEYAARAKVTFVAPEAEFTPKEVETRSERDKLMFRVKLGVPPSASARHRADQDRDPGRRLRPARRLGHLARTARSPLPGARPRPARGGRKLEGGNVSEGQGAPTASPETPAPRS